MKNRGIMKQGIVVILMVAVMFTVAVIQGNDMKLYADENKTISINLKDDYVKEYGSIDAFRKPTMDNIDSNGIIFSANAKLDIEWSCEGKVENEENKYRFKGIINGITDNYYYSNSNKKGFEVDITINKNDLEFDPEDKKKSYDFSYKDGELNLFTKENIRLIYKKNDYEVPYLDSKNDFYDLVDISTRLFESEDKANNNKDDDCKVLDGEVGQYYAVINIIGKDNKTVIFDSYKPVKVNIYSEEQTPEEVNINVNAKCGEFLEDLLKNTLNNNLKDDGAFDELKDKIVEQLGKINKKLDVGEVTVEDLQYENKLITLKITTTHDTDIVQGYDADENKRICGNIKHVKCKGCGAKFRVDDTEFKNPLSDIDVTIPVIKSKVEIQLGKNIELKDFVLDGEEAISNVSTTSDSFISWDGKKITTKNTYSKKKYSQKVDNTIYVVHPGGTKKVTVDITIPEPTFMVSRKPIVIGGIEGYKYTIKYNKLFDRKNANISIEVVSNSVSKKTKASMNKYLKNKIKKSKKNNITITFTIKKSIMKKNKIKFKATIKYGNKFKNTASKTL